MRLSERIRRAMLRRLLPIPVEARHAEYSVISSTDDDPAAPTPRLIEIAIEAIRHAQHASMDAICARMARPPHFANVWPGENYKLLAGLMLALKPKLVVEVGTGGGSGTLAMRHAMPADAKLVTFDIVAWHAYPEHLLRADDFADGRLVQHVADVSQPDVFPRYQSWFEQADFFFIDAAKDGVLEFRLAERFGSMRFPKRPLMLFDDIRVWNMLRFWRSLPYPKLDLTSFGHWCGTGLIEWRAEAAAGAPATSVKRA